MIHEQENNVSLINTVWSICYTSHETDSDMLLSAVLKYYNDSFITLGTDY